MLVSTPTQYNALPTRPSMGMQIPRGPWPGLYRNVAPGLRGLSGPVQILGAENAGAGKKIAAIAIGAVASGVLGAAYAIALKKKKHDVLYPALVFGGFAVVAGVLNMAIKAYQDKTDSASIEESVAAAAAAAAEAAAAAKGVAGFGSLHTLPPRRLFPSLYR